MELKENIKLKPNHYVSFGELKMGDIFHNREIGICMKARLHGDGGIIAVNLAGGNEVSIDDSEQVYKIKAYLEHEPLPKG